MQDLSFARTMQIFDYITRKEDTTYCGQCGIFYWKTRKIHFEDGICQFCLSGRKAARVIGIGSLTADGTHFLQWDFDNTKLCYIIDDLKRIQRRFNLSHIHILRSSPGDNYMGVCFDKFKEEIAEDIMRSSKCVDINYRYIFQYRNHSTLRISPKVGPRIQYVWTLISYSAQNLQSLSAWKVYSELFREIKEYQLKNSDNLDYPFIEGWISRHVGEQHYV